MEEDILFRVFENLLETHSHYFIRSPAERYPKSLWNDPSSGAHFGEELVWKKVTDKIRTFGRNHRNKVSSSWSIIRSACRASSIPTFGTEHSQRIRPAQCLQAEPSTLNASGQIRPYSLNRQLSARPPLPWLPFCIYTYVFIIVSYHWFLFLNLQAYFGIYVQALYFGSTIRSFRCISCLSLQNMTPLIFVISLFLKFDCFVCVCVIVRIV